MTEVDKLTLSCSSTQITSNCGFAHVSFIDIVDKNGKTVTDVKRLEAWIDSGDFDTQLLNKARYSPTAPRSCVAISQRVASNFGGDADVATSQTYCGIALLMALANSTKGIFMMTPPIYNQAHPSGDSVIICALYIPSTVQNSILLNEAVYRIQDDKMPVNTWKPKTRTDLWQKVSEKLPDQLKRTWTCLTKLSYPSEQTLETSPKELNSVGSSVPTVMEGPAEKELSPLKPHTPTSHIPAIAVPAERGVQSLGELSKVKLARKSTAPKRKRTKDPFGW